MGRIVLFGATVFLSAFLLFQVQPVIGKAILPWFGSSPGVWNACLLFFQVALLGGYAYAHLLVSRLTPRRQAIVHASVIALALVALPITPSTTFKPTGSEAPVGRVILVLLTSVGLPYFVLSSTGPLLQGWFARLHPGRAVYRLYALSNVGSLLALLTYPFVVEPGWTLRTQAVNWSVGFGAFALLGGACAWALARGRVRPPPLRTDVDAGALPQPVETVEPARPRAGDLLLWFALSACGSALLLATTNQLCLDVAVMPFLWVVPLAIYLLSFIVTFDHERWYVRPVVLLVLPLVLLRTYQLTQEGVSAQITHQIGGYALMLLVACLALHGELSRAKPAPRHLTLFFLVVSFGGAVGGLLVALGAPAAFDDFLELPLLMVAAYALVAVAALRNVLRERVEPTSARTVARGAALLLAAAAGLWLTVQVWDPATWVGADPAEGDLTRVKGLIETYRPWLWVALVLPFLVGEVARWVARVGYVDWWRSLRRNAAVAAGVLAGLGVLGLVTASAYVVAGKDKRYIARGRNFYGSLAVTEYYKGERWHDWTLRHGRIMHGFQYKRSPEWPTSYYGTESGLGLSIVAHPDRWTEGRPFRIGVVGLGTGTIAAFANARIDGNAMREEDYVTPALRTPGDVVRYYEINPMVREWAGRYFTYLADARARGADVDVYMGDARLVLERQLAEGQPQAFDVFAIDAFSSDAIPIHLLTRESCELYFRHIAPGGVLAIHVTNRFINLVPVVRKIAEALGKELVYVENKDDRWGIDGSDWMLLTTNTRMLDELYPYADQMLPLKDAEGHEIPDPLWTDDFSSVYPLVKHLDAFEERGWLRVLGDVVEGRFNLGDDD